MKIQAYEFVVGDPTAYDNRYVIAFGAYGSTKLLSYANSFEAALEACEDWILEHAPGLTCTDAVHEQYAVAKLEGLSDDDAWECATMDTISIDSGNHYLHSWEVNLVAENPTRAQLAEIFGVK